MTTESMSRNDLERRIETLRKKFALHMSVGDGDEANKIRDEIGVCYQHLMNTPKERTSHEQ